MKNCNPVSFAVSVLLFALAQVSCVSGKLWIDSFEQDGFTVPPGTPVVVEGGPMSYTNLIRYKEGQFPGTLHGGGWIGGNSASRSQGNPSWQLKAGGVFTPISVDFACINSFNQPASCTVVATGELPNRRTVTHMMRFNAGPYTFSCYTNVYALIWPD
ncbi:hypothetical protein DRE_03387 [Drechslerella stenobrocha 248]|uniref:Ubiquitin 3 binding protein But2 C-terminal domain-containing protein n=1 Tax=Drechslerella stenobrocha 248 TaxID=1043628 RepID=W7I516_9PEZI|nr:hypothetical protein DRE_03387 [Drechslerella stenobrocha 248]